MSRFLLLPPFILWMAWAANPVHAGRTCAWGFLGFYLLLVLGLGVWGKLLARRVHAANLHRSVERFKKLVFLGRWIIPAWFAVGLYQLGWGDVVLNALGPAAHWPVELPAILAGTAPAFLAWAGLFWAQYPADRALNEQSLLIRLDSGLPIRAPQTMRAYLAGHFRMQVLFTLLPIYCIVGMKDAIFCSILLAGFHARNGGMMEILSSLAAVAIVFPLAPELLRRTLRTRRLEDSDLRRRLEELFARTHLKCREILLWLTDSTVGNAAVMGVLPRWRYILISDLLLETMTDEQIEAVFAHEVGHIKHRHMAWNIAVLILAGGVGGALADLLQSASLPLWISSDLSATLLFFGVFVAMFGWVSRRFERQADVYAARMLEADAVLVGAETSDEHPQLPTSSTFVGPHGAKVFSSALYRVASVNNLRTSARPWTGGGIRNYLSYLLDRLKHSADNYLHGSIESRRMYLEKISADPEMTRKFDRFMAALDTALILGLLALAFWIAQSMLP